MKGRFFLRTFPKEPSGVTSILLNYDSAEVSKSLDASLSAKRLAAKRRKLTVYRSFSSS
jgi:hypothetical protein